MNLVSRWFMETTEGEMLDGPFRSRREAEKTSALYAKTYKYIPVVIERVMDADTFIAAESYNESSDQIGRTVGRGSHRADNAAQQGTACAGS